MSSHCELTGSNILVVEDDYYLAMDAQSWLEKAGAHVVGPFAKADEAMAQVALERVDAALLDVNLGSGPAFDLARALQERRIPFAFLTGYDQSVIPAELQSVPRLEKPVATEEVSRVVQALVGQAT